MAGRFQNAADDLQADGLVIHDKNARRSHPLRRRRLAALDF
jgi:hypothetical protein